MRFDHDDHDDFNNQQESGTDTPEFEGGASFLWGLMGVVGVFLLFLILFAVLVGVFVAASHGLGLVLARILPLSVGQARLLSLVGAVGMFVALSLLFILMTLGGCHAELGRIAMDTQELNSRLNGLFVPLDEPHDDGDEEENF